MNDPWFLQVDPKKLKSDERILVAAMKIFADTPVEQASLRAIAQEADISFSAITYHFKTKENLYREVVRRILDYALSTLPVKLGETADPVSPEAAGAELRGLISGWAEWIYGDSRATIAARILLREHLAPSAVYDSLYEEFFSKVIDRITRIVRVLGGLTKERRATIQAMSILGQVIAFRFERELFIRHLGFTGYTPEEREELKAVLTENVFRQLGVEP